MRNTELAGSEPVSLEEMLDARETRVSRQRQLVEQYNGVLICLTLNIAGPYKSFPLAVQTFREAIFRITKQLSLGRIPVLHYEKQLCKTGPIAFFSVKTNPITLKRKMVEIEEGDPLGRLFDIDVLQPDGLKISREEVDCPARKCLLCSRRAVLCARSRTHTVEAVSQRTLSVMKRYFRSGPIDRIASSAVRALLYELAVTPKPGLVDRNNNGSHPDMDFFLFLDSASTLFSYFLGAARLGFDDTGVPGRLFQKLRTLGRMAEQQMLFVTHGINTHKGAIFLLGILSTAAGRLLRSGERMTPESLFSLGAQIAAPAMRDFDSVTEQNAKTAGERLYLQYGLTGVRGEAAGGYPSVQNHALPILRSMLAKGYDKDEAGAVALLALMANVQDSTTIHRSNFSAQQKFQLEVQKLLHEQQTPEQRMDAAKQLDIRMRRRGLSAGGCADLLAAAWLALFLEDFWEEPACSTSSYTLIHSMLSPASLHKHCKTE